MHLTGQTIGSETCGLLNGSAVSDADLRDAEKYMVWYFERMHKQPALKAKAKVKIDLKPQLEQEVQEVHLHDKVKQAQQQAGAGAVNKVSPAACASVVTSELSPVRLPWLNDSTLAGDSRYQQRERAGGGAGVVLSTELVLGVININNDTLYSARSTETETTKRIKKQSNNGNISKLPYCCCAHPRSVACYVILIMNKQRTSNIEHMPPSKCSSGPLLL